MTSTMHASTGAVRQSGPNNDQSSDNLVRPVRVLPEKTILIAVGDHATFSRLRSALVVDQGQFAVHHVATAGQAVNFCRRENVDCVLLAESLDHDGGGQVITQIRSASGSLSLPVLYLAEGSACSFDSARFGSADALSLGDASEQQLPERVHRLIERCVVENTRSVQQLQNELLNLELIRRQQILAEEMETVVHALRTPLGVIQEFISLVIDGVGGPVTEKQGKFLALARGSCESLDGEIGRLYQVMDLNSALTRSHERPTMVGDLLQIAIRSSEPDALLASVQTSFDFDQALPQVRCDSLQISQVLVELIAVGIKYVGAGGALSLTAGTGSTDGVQRIAMNLQCAVRNNVVDLDPETSAEGSLSTFTEYSDLVTEVLNAHGTELDVSQLFDGTIECAFELPAYYTATANQ